MIVDLESLADAPVPLWAVDGEGNGVRLDDASEAILIEYGYGTLVIEDNPPTLGGMLALGQERTLEAGIPTERTVWGMPNITAPEFHLFLRLADLADTFEERVPDLLISGDLSVAKAGFIAENGSEFEFETTIGLAQMLAPELELEPEDLMADWLLARTTALPES